MLKSNKLGKATTLAAGSVLAAALAVLILWEAKPAEATFPGANGKIAFESDGEIRTMNPDGTD